MNPKLMDKLIGVLNEIYDSEAVGADKLKVLEEAKDQCQNYIDNLEDDLVNQKWLGRQ